MTHLHLSLTTAGWDRFVFRLRSLWTTTSQVVNQQVKQWYTPERLWLLGGALLLGLFIWALISGYHPTH